MRNAKLGDNRITQQEKFSAYCLDTTLVLPSGSCPCLLTNLPLKKKKESSFHSMVFFGSSYSVRSCFLTTFLLDSQVEGELRVETQTEDDYGSSSQMENHLCSFIVPQGTLHLVYSICVVLRQ